MEIRNVVSEVKNEYPKMEKVDKKFIKTYVPNKWQKIGLAFLGISMIMENKIFSIDVMTPNSFIATAAPAASANRVGRMCGIICGIVQLISIVAIIITSLSILLIKIKYKKRSETKKVKKWIVVILIISIIIFFLCELIKFLALDLEVWSYID